ncbi:uncharacterized protein MYCFIDRAFT_174895 [Pseudocercospora fijiensis CIRAD86]|uniref:Uncharacterized protein n=1 Tax=Pseudocercospora fijiensis (strain CIRAD86) TaxID=383855 RepID=M3AFU6_PSEFD|nr:uncharacterized protein MYCFIDRAFT_174895 [Pseudocercospora fijiensis CIRAD86]EME83466.1 hypothetical protein MYCFIDRAFT_174895 [Pseudocercospora fijiensis CIRAD86]
MARHSEISAPLLHSRRGWKEEMAAIHTTYGRTPFGALPWIDQPRELLLTTRPVQLHIILQLLLYYYWRAITSLTPYFDLAIWLACACTHL